VNKPESRQPLVARFEPQLALLNLLQDIGSLLEHAPSEHDALTRIVERICACLRCEYGACWNEDEQTHELVCTQIWHEPALTGSAFVELTLNTSYIPGVGGLIRTTLSSRKPYAVEDISTVPGLRRAPAALAAGLRSAFAFPLLAGGRPLGAMEFFCRESRAPDDMVTAITVALGSMVGEFLSRRQAEARYRELVEQSPDALLVQCDGVYAYANLAAVAVLGAKDVSQILGCDAISIVHPDFRDVFRARVQRMYEERSGTPVAELKFLRFDGTAFDVEASSRYFIFAGRPAIQTIFRDVSARKRSEERLSFLAQYDVLTGLPNRALFYDRLKQAVGRARREQTMLGLMFLDLDRFKQINDTLGHAAGDRVLKVVAERLQGFLREVDTIARLGGDEFTVIIEGVSQREQLAGVAEKIGNALAAAVQLDGREMSVSASIGITLYPRDGEDIDQLIKNADIAMYHAKQRGGRQQFQFYDPSMGALAADHLELETKLRRAVDKQEFQLHYQPVVDTASGRIIGMEALVRWQSPEGLIPPAKFIPLAEESGLILDIGKWVLQSACAQARKWQREGLPPLRLAVNLSPLQLRQENLFASVAEILRQSGLAAPYLELEITENTVIERSQNTMVTLTRLEQLGVQLSIDDFGTGYSSLAYLKQLPVHSLKIDRTFVRDITTDRDDAAIVSAMIVMAKSLDLRVIAEGVETRQQLEFLRTSRCDAYQGYYFSVPLPAHAFAELVRRQPRQ
jgi:diguanylate cyclase (GGDEF)-like protein/PAS domain S-box-containing protein